MLLLLREPLFWDWREERDEDMVLMMWRIGILLCGRLGGQALPTQNKRGFVIRMMWKGLGSSRHFYVDHRGLDRNVAGDEDNERA